MNPKEKASQLINDFYDITYYSANDYDERFRIAKQCALITVNEMYDLAYISNDIKTANYLVDVEKEIKLI